MRPVTKIHFGDEGEALTIIFEVTSESKFYNDFVHGENGYLLEFTGLKDKNGKEIYTGDILETEFGIAYVVWIDAAFALKSPGSEAIDWENSSVYEKSEIIGNVFENPELIK